MNLNSYVKRISEVIKVEAKDTSHSVFLATHKPFTRIRYVETGDSAQEAQVIDEEGLFELFMRGRDRHQFYVVKGDNGTGKSHLIRWIKEKYISLVSESEEAVLFISRAQSTLRGALEQIIEANLFDNQQMTDKLKKLVQANEHLSNAGLKQRLLHHFAIAVEQDDDTKPVKLSTRERKRLYAFLVEQETQALLLHENGPIERIQQKLASEARNEVMTDVNPYFEADDFKITYQQASQVQKSDVSKNAMKFVESVAETTIASEMQEVLAFRSKCADYLNQFLDIVVQECTQLRGTDLRDVFMLLRQELKKQGKQLTLFIEDITSFTGIDKELVNVLGFTNEGTAYDESLCRLISVVGVTNWYYANHFPSNYVDRVTGEIYIDGAAFASDSDVIDLAARYLNAIYQDGEALDQWAQGGANPDQLPVSTLFAEHAWANCEIDGKTFTLFPFTPQALLHFYRNLDQPTPRRFLRNVISKYVRELLVQGANAFIPDFTGLVKTMKQELPSWSIADDARLKRAVEEDTMNRYMTLLRIWGNASTEVAVTADGKRTIGGLSEEVFRSFGLKPPQFDAEPVSRPEPAEPKPAKPVPNAVVNPVPSENAKFLDLQKKLERWKDGEALAGYGNLLQDSIEFLRQSIHWEDLGIPATYVNAFLTVHRVEIEGQFGQTKASGDNKFTIHRGDSSRYALLALGAWRELGGRSWDFPEAHVYLQALTDWLHQETQKVIDFVRKPPGELHWGDEEWIVGAQFYYTALCGGFTGEEQTPEQIYAKFNYLSVETFPERKPAWGRLMKICSEGQPEKFHFHYLRFFNRAQGDLNSASATKVFFLDAERILSSIDRFSARKWDVSAEIYPANKRLLWHRGLDILLPVKEWIPLVLKEELEAIRSVRKQLLDYTDGDLSQLPEVFDRMVQMLEWLREQREPFDPKPFEFIASPAYKIYEFMEQANRLERIDTLDTPGEQVIALSSNPLQPLEPYLNVLNHINLLMDKLIESHRGQLVRSGADPNDIHKKLSEIKANAEDTIHDLMIAKREMAHAADQNEHSA